MIITFNKTLAVCVGNICRSPTAERLLRQFRSALTVSSVDPEALVGRGADPYAISVAWAYNLLLDNHCARQTMGRMCREYGLIPAMEKHHISALCKMVPEMRGKVMSFGHWDSERRVPDPYRKSRGSSDAAYALLERSAHQWAQTLNTEQEEQ